MSQFTNIIDENIDLNIAYGFDEEHIDKKIIESLNIAELGKAEKISIKNKWEKMV